MDEPMQDLQLAIFGIDERQLYESLIGMAVRILPGPTRLQRLFAGEVGHIYARDEDNLHVVLYGSTVSISPHDVEFVDIEANRLHDRLAELEKRLAELEGGGE